MNQVTQFAEAVSKSEPETTDTELARQVAFVFLTPAQLFAVFVRALAHKYAPIIFRYLSYRYIP